VLCLGTKAETERTGTTGSASPSLTKVRGLNRFRLRIGCVADPKQLKVAVRKEEPTARRALSRMHVGRPLSQTECRQCTGLFATDRDTDEDVVKFRGHDWADVRRNAA
jgi:hypothetical protein